MDRVVWPDEVIDQIDQIAAYIEVFNPAAARTMSDSLFALGNALSSSSRRGRPLPDGSRELVSVKPCILRYEMVGDVVTPRHVRQNACRPLA